MKFSVHKKLFISIVIILLIIIPFLLLNKGGEKDGGPTPTATTGTDADSQRLNIFDEQESQLSKDVRPDGTTISEFRSPRESRPNIAITHTDGSGVLYERSVVSQEVPVLLADYLKNFGQAERTLSGSSFYGKDAKTYIYAEQGISFTADATRILEIHTFSPMTVDAYLKTYGELL